MKKPLFKLHSPFPPAGSQVEAIKQLNKGRPGRSTLVGVTGSGKTFTMANIIAEQGKPVIILSPNKTLAAQLYEEFSLFFPENKVCYFVSYYDYYQPESYMPAQDIYVPKETKVNSEIERLRIEAAASIVSRKDVIIITSISCIYSLGNPADYKELALAFKVGQKITRNELVRKLIFIQYERNEIKKEPSTFQVLGQTIEINLPYAKDKLRIELDEQGIESLAWVSKHNNMVLAQVDDMVIWPAKNFVITDERKVSAIESIKRELQWWLPQLPNPLWQERLQTRVTHDIEMLQEVGYCSGVENYSIHITGRMPGAQPYCLFDFFDNGEFLLIIDESHIAIPQMKGMYAGDKARKQSLIDFGFRLPSASDNRPLKFAECEQYFKDVIFVSATPSEYELTHSDQIVEQIIRPTGLVDPVIELHPRKGQMDHLIDQINKTTKKGFRTLVTVLTKKLAEELARYLEEQQIKVCFLHSELKTPQRSELLQKLRQGTFDCLVGVNLLREGLDLPEVALVAIMDADVESYLRDKRSLIQTIGRAARNTESKVILFADKMTQSMRGAIDENNRRRAMQQAYNKEHGITPVSAKREVTKSIVDIQKAIAAASAAKSSKKKVLQEHLEKDPALHMLHLEKEMRKAAEKLDFEKAIALRAQWLELNKKLNEPK